MIKKNNMTNKKEFLQKLDKLSADKAQLIEKIKSSKNQDDNYWETVKRLNKVIVRIIYLQLDIDKL